MDAITMIKERRSVRKFKEDKVDRAILNDILSITSYAPTWKNSQSIRYTIVDSKEMLNILVEEGFGSFKHNKSILSQAPGCLVVSVVKGKSGIGSGGKYETKKGDTWEMFDAGIACQTFCLAAYEKAVGTLIMGIFDEDKVAELVNLPENERIAAIITYGYEVKHPKTPSRKKVEEIVRYM